MSGTAVRPGVGPSDGGWFDCPGCGSTTSGRIPRCAHRGFGSAPPPQAPPLPPRPYPAAPSSGEVRLFIGALAGSLAAACIGSTVGGSFGAGSGPIVTAGSMPFTEPGIILAVWGSIVPAPIGALVGIAIARPRERGFNTSLPTRTMVVPGGVVLGWGGAFVFVYFAAGHS